MAEPERAPSFLEALNRYEWHAEAACRDEPEEDLFFPDSGSMTKISSPRVLLPLLYCAECPVRRECLEESYATWNFVRGELERDVKRRRWSTYPERQTEPSRGIPQARGIWGGSTEEEREALRVQGLSDEDAIECLDTTTQQRFEIRIDAYLEHRAELLAESKRSGAGRYSVRVDSILRERGYEVPERAK
jgi:hypothetical protein